MSLPRYRVSTADWVAAARDWHFNNTLPVFKDPYARAFSGRILNAVQVFRPLSRFIFAVALNPIMPASMCVLMRARYAEERLAEWVSQGTRQYVILGAGMDSFGFRRSDLMQRIQLFEVDHPVTQARKLRRVHRAGLEVMANHHFVAADLSRVSASDALARTPFDFSEPAFVSLLGVSYYLTKDDLVLTLGDLGKNMRARAQVVVDYLLDPRCSDPDTQTLRRKMYSFVERRGEPLRSAYSMSEISQRLSSVGFRTVENLRMVELSEAYIRDLDSAPFQPPDMFAFGHFETV